MSDPLNAPVAPVSPLSFATLREAGRVRTPQFKNRLGGLAHSTPDGSDWTPAVWLQALVGELGEYARVRHQYEIGELSYEDFVIEARKELADVQCHLDLLSMRALDKVDTTIPHQDSAQALQQLVAGLGEYANWRKKYERGDMPLQAFQAVAFDGLVEVSQQLPALYGVRPYRSQVTEAHATGIDLGQAVTDKFNEVSVRVGVAVRLDGNTVRIG